MSRPLRLLKFDSVHPPAYLLEKQEEEREQIRGMGYAEYYRWLMGLRNGTSDAFTHYMNESGWQASEFVTSDPVLLQKLEEAGESPAWSSGRAVRAMASHLASQQLWQLPQLRLLRTYSYRKRYERVRNYIDAFRPDVLFLREPCHMNGSFFDRYRDRCLIVSLVACQTDQLPHWNAHRHDVIFTFTEDYRRFFEVQGIRSEVLPVGFDERVSAELPTGPKIYGCTFVGYLGVPAQRRKTELLEEVARQIDFKWWGIKGAELVRYPALEKSWQGTASGLDMLKIYRQSKIVLNDYPDFMRDQGNNLRNMEVFMSGSMLLTRAAGHVEQLEREGALVTFDSAASCVAKARHYLAADNEREAIAAKGQDLARAKFNYRDIVRRVMAVITETYEEKRAGRRTLSPEKN